MFLKLLDGVTALPLWTHAAAAVATVASFQWTRGWLEAGYAASRRPVDFATGQTAFSGEKIKGYFAHTQKTGTLDVYWTTQVIDYGFILAMVCMGLFVCTFVARFSRGGRRQGPPANGPCQGNGRFTKRPYDTLPESSQHPSFRRKPESILKQNKNTPDFHLPVIGENQSGKKQRQNKWIPSNPPALVGSDTGMTSKIAFARSGQAPAPVRGLRACPAFRGCLS